LAGIGEKGGGSGCFPNFGSRAFRFVVACIYVYSVIGRFEIYHCLFGSIWTWRGIARWDDALRDKVTLGENVWFGKGRLSLERTVGANGCPNARNVGVSLE
jgi:hypothetical protein